MGDKKTKVVLDADVINHFSRAGRLSLLPNILPEFQFIVLDIVKNRTPNTNFRTKDRRTGSTHSSWRWDF